MRRSCPQVRFSAHSRLIDGSATACPANSSVGRLLREIRRRWRPSRVDAYGAAASLPELQRSGPPHHCPGTTVWLQPRHSHRRRGARGSGSFTRFARTGDDCLSSAGPPALARSISRVAAAGTARKSASFARTPRDDLRSRHAVANADRSDDIDPGRANDDIASRPSHCGPGHVDIFRARTV